MKIYIALSVAALAATTTLAAVVSPVAATSPRVRHEARCPLPRFGPGADYHPQIHPGRFGPHVDNPWFPLPVGTTFVYQGVDSGRNAVDVFAPSRRTKTIEGVRTRVVHDRLYIRGVLRERTSDYYAQDVCGDVWYFGEDTAELDRAGHVVNRDGSWRAGRRGGQPGVYMQAHPQVGRKFRQEWAPGSAEDQFHAIAAHGPVHVPYGTFHASLRTRESTALEPGVLDGKIYVRGLGEVAELSIKGGDDRLALVDVLR